MKIVAMKIQTEAGLKKVIACMERTDPEQAQKILENLFEDEFDCTELVFTADCCNFWIPYIRQLDHQYRSITLFSYSPSYLDTIN